jgi:hypothetical protein
MSNFFPHEKLHVYKNSIQFHAFAEQQLAEWPSGHAVDDQFRRAVESVVYNIMYGAMERSARTKQNHASIAMGSTLECAACLDIALASAAKTLATIDLLDSGGVIEVELADNGRLRLREIGAMLAALRKYWVDEKE